MKEAIIFILLFCPAIQLAGQILKVPTEFSTIQQAINQANNGDTIIVDEGTYKENLVIEDKSIVLCSRFLESGDEQIISNTILDGDHMGSVININSYTARYSVVINGFTLINGTRSYGGGINVGNYSTVLENLIIKDNIADYGSGIASWRSGGRLKIQNTQVMNNRMNNEAEHDYWGINYGAIWVIGVTEDLEIINSKICDNEGGGINIEIPHWSYYTPYELYDSTYTKVNIQDTEISNNTGSIGGISIKADHTYIKNTEISKNTAGFDGNGIFIDSDHTILENVTLCDNVGENDLLFKGFFEIINSIIWKNRITIRSGDDDYKEEVVGKIEYSDIEYGKDNILKSCRFEYNEDKKTVEWGNGNLERKPEFVNPEEGDFSLAENSPCIDTGHPDPAYTDRDGSRNDMGAHEFGTVTHHGKLFSGDAIKLYPNPAGDKVIITTESTEILTLELFDYTGKLIAIERFVSGDQMDIRNLEPGIYLATIKNGSAVVGIKKLIKK